MMTSNLTVFRESIKLLQNVLFAAFLGTEFATLHTVNASIWSSAKLKHT